MLAEQSLVAKFSPGRKYRYMLTRRVGLSEDAVSFVMLNPSTADETQDDPTIRRCIGFANRWGFGWLYVVNLSPLRATDPKQLLVAGPEPKEVWVQNMSWVKDAAMKSNMVIVAWGAHGALDDRDREMAWELRETAGMLYCLGTTKDGHPRHPLYIPADTPPTPFTWPYRGGAMTRPSKHGGKANGQDRVLVNDPACGF